MSYLLLLVVPSAGLFLIMLLRLSLLRRFHRSPGSGRETSLFELDREQIERFRQLLRMPTVSHYDPADDDPAAFREFGDYLTSAFPLFSDSLEIHRLSSVAWYAVWRGLEPELRPGLLLAHFDVVPAPPEGWRYGPFEAREAEGSLWGRGALDDKNSLFGILQAVELLLSDGSRPRRTLYFAFGGDEECSGSRGAARLAEEFRTQGLRFAFALDEGSIVARNLMPGFSGSIGMIGIEEKGFANVRLSTRAAAGHASMPGSGTATHRLVRAAARLTRRRLPARITPGLRLFLETLAPSAPFVTGLVFANLWLFAPLLKLLFSRSPRTDALIRTTLALTILSGGERENVLPDEARAVFNVRILPGESLEGVLAELGRRVDDPEVLVEPLNPAVCFDPSAASSTGSEAFMAIREALASAFPQAVPAPFLVNVTTDSRWYLPLCDNVYRFVPMELESGELASIHGINEHITTENLTAGVLFYRELIGRL